ncbi:hypothetical protein KSP40_PGU001753 [Platanthera guangdongensis]|uniref:RING-type domain-containing protein n=1 Tax=Platanthera guangdongensis TaxID=2320717 RepID=A0ABR2LD09_9ASPA
MNGAVSRRTRKTLLNKLSSPEQQNGAGSTGQRTTLLDAIQQEAVSARAPPQREPAQPMRVSLMTLLTLGEEALAKDQAPSCSISAKGVISVAVSPEEDSAAAAAEEKMLCCVCMVNRKGAAFIPCGHTFCRACSRALVTSRGNCPICNEAIFDILDIF